VGVEVERKFLVAGDGWRRGVPPGQAGTPIRQGYLVRHPERSVRVRRQGDRGYLTVKGAGTVSRAEFEYPIPPEDADQLIDTLCEPGTVTKTRHRVPVGDLVWEVDEFHGRLAGLVLAEVELGDPDAPVDLPPWVGREVTGDPAYTNAVLSRPGATPPEP
jgi:CYTH domain-containing protein